MRQIETLPGGWGGKRALVVTDSHGQRWAYRQSAIDPRMLERAPIIRRDDTPSFGEDAEFIEGFHEPDVYAALGFNSMGGDAGVGVGQTSIAYTVNGGTAPVNIIGALPRNVASISAVVTFSGSPGQPVNAGEQVNFMAQNQAGGAAFEFDFEILAQTGPGQWTAGTAPFTINGPNFQNGHDYNTWAVYPGDSANVAATSNIVVINIAGT